MSAVARGQGARCAEDVRDDGAWRPNGPDTARRAKYPRRLGAWRCGAGA